VAGLQFAEMASAEAPTGYVAGDPAWAHVSQPWRPCSTPRPRRSGRKSWAFRACMWWRRVLGFPIS